MSLTLKPISLKAARAFVREHHRHHPSIQGGKFAIAAVAGNEVIGVAVVGRPCRMEDDGWTAEVTRVAAAAGHRNVCSFLLARAKRAAQAMGYIRVRTRTLVDESGASLRGAGWERLREVAGGSWSRPSRPRADKHPTGAKVVWAGRIAEAKRREVIRRNSEAIGVAEGGVV